MAMAMAPIPTPTPTPTLLSSFLRLLLSLSLSSSVEMKYRRNEMTVATIEVKIGALELGPSPPVGQWTEEPPLYDILNEDRAEILKKFEPYVEARRDGRMTKEQMCVIGRHLTTLGLHGTAMDDYPFALRCFFEASWFSVKAHGLSNPIHAPYLADLATAMYNEGKSSDQVVLSILIAAARLSRMPLPMGCQCGCGPTETNEAGIIRQLSSVIEEMGLDCICIRVTSMRKEEEGGGRAADDDEKKAMTAAMTEASAAASSSSAASSTAGIRTTLRATWTRDASSEEVISPSTFNDLLSLSVVKIISGDGSERTIQTEWESIGMTEDAAATTATTATTAASSSRYIGTIVYASESTIIMPRDPFACLKFGDAMLLEGHSSPSAKRRAIERP